MKTNDEFEVGSDQLNSWGIPDQYFEKLEDNVMQQWQSSKPNGRDMSIFRWLWLPVGVAASFLLLIFSWEKEQSDLEMMFNDEELAYYYLYTSEKEEVDDLWYDFSEMEIDDLEEWLVNEEFDIETLNELY